MSQPAHRRLKKAKAFLGRPSSDTNDVRSTSTDSGVPEKVRRMLRILLKSPWDDYSYIRHLGQTMLALRKASSFQLAEIREVSSFDVLGDPPILPHVQHPNIATLYDIYCHDDRIFLITEHLEVSFAQLKFQEYELEEREIATILAEILKGVAYISSLRLSCKDLSQKNIWLSLDGEIKLVLDLRKLKYNDLYESPKVSQVLLDFPILAEIIEEMMLSSSHLNSGNERWSKDALDFLSCTVEGSFESLINHCFLKKAVSPRVLRPRIRFVHEAKRGSQDSGGEEEQAFDFNFATST